MTLYGDIDLGQHWPRQGFGAWRHQAITLTNVDLASTGFCDTYLRPISQEVLNISTCRMSLENYFHV